MGSNLGDREAALRRGLGELQARGVRIHRVSSVYETEPVGFRDQGSFLNLALEVSWGGTLEELCRCSLASEESLHRRRIVKDGPRTLDVDLLLAQETIVSSENLQIPHPRMHLRRFVLVPLVEIAPQAVHPGFRKTVRELLHECPDSSWVRRVGDPFAVEPS